MQRVLITGAGRGIGLALATEYVRRGDHVLAGARSLDRAPGLQQLLARYPETTTVLPLEVTADEAIEESFRLTRERVDALDVLVNNAGISPGDLARERAGGRQVMDPERALDMLRVNAVAPVVVAQSFLPLLAAGNRPRIVNVSSGAGSLTQKTDGGLYSYSASKAALNMYTRTLAWDLRPRGIIVIALDPGWVKSDMGGPGAAIEPEESARAVVPLIDGLTLEQTGGFFHYQGGTIPW